MGKASARKIRFVINSRDIGALDALRQEAVRLRGEGHTVEGRITFEGGDAERLAREAADEGFDCVVAAGGDGTLFEVANGLLTTRRPRAAADLPKMGIVPLGTANDLANWLAIPLDVPGAIRHSLEGPEREVDVATVNGRYFLNVSTGGFGAEATDDAPARVKRAVGILAYLAQGVRKLASLTPLSARFTEGDEVIHEGEFLLFAVGNGARTGGGNFVTSRADMGDGLLDLCIVLPMSRSEFVRLAPDLRSGQHVGNPNVIYRQVRELRIEGSDTMSVNADGEPVDAPSFLYGLKPGALRLPAPFTGA